VRKRSTRTPRPRGSTSTGPAPQSASWQLWVHLPPHSHPLVPMVAPFTSNNSATRPLRGSCRLTPYDYTLYSLAERCLTWVTLGKHGRAISGLRSSAYVLSRSVARHSPADVNLHAGAGLDSHEPYCHCASLGVRSLMSLAWRVYLSGSISFKEFSVPCGASLLAPSNGPVSPQPR